MKAIMNFPGAQFLTGMMKSWRNQEKKRLKIIEYMEEVIEKKDGGIKRIISGREGYFLTGQLDNGLQLIMFMPNSRLHKKKKDIFLFFMLLFLISLPLFYPRGNLFLQAVNQSHKGFIQCSQKNIRRPSGCSPAVRKCG